MSVTYTINDWISAMKGVPVVAHTPGGTPESTTLTSKGTVVVANGEFDAFADLTTKLLQIPKDEAGN